MQGKNSRIRRSRLEHTQLAHSYLMVKENQVLCNACNVCNGLTYTDTSYIYIYIYIYIYQNIKNEYLRIDKPRTCLRTS